MSCPLQSKEVLLRPKLSTSAKTKTIMLGGAAVADLNVPPPRNKKWVILE